MSVFLQHILKFLFPSLVAMWLPEVQEDYNPAALHHRREGSGHREAAARPWLGTSHHFWYVIYDMLVDTRCASGVP